MASIIVSQPTTIPSVINATDLEKSALLWDTFDNLLLSGEIDLRAEMTTILENRGHWMFLRRQTNVKAPSNDHLAGETTIEDPLSWRGYLYKDEPYKVRERPVAAEAAGSSVGHFLTALGLWTARNLIFYMPWYSNPSTSDGLVYCTLKSDGSFRKPYNIERIYAIEATFAYRDQNGRIEFWVAVAQQIAAGK